MLILGLTGGIATGKSTVSKHLAEKHNIPIIDADKIAREIVEPGTPCYNLIVEYFAPLIPDLIDLDTGVLNRGALGAHVFTHKKDLEKLNSITHPAVKKKILHTILKEYFSFSPVVILDVPLLFESGMDWLCSKVLTITCNDEIQLRRLLHRNKDLTRDQALSRINSQMKVLKKAQMSDYIIENNGTLDDLVTKVDEFVCHHLHALNSKACFDYWVNLAEVLFPPLALVGALYALSRRFSVKYF
ncbi:dephospho-CoA kinase [Pichia kudriavzevii]|uniref:Dephospho-CoA kinase n=1 Tax=Pichia kudriavzevii TaxID=4909 RepID=A0A099NWE5_PICKU|nr:hypothetical protein JL09_g4563 [Pichia kudriavzevii]OUT21668.1 dephospho-CoA kinase [Pichia kudriavzevii]